MAPVHLDLSSANVWISSFRGRRGADAECNRGRLNELICLLYFTLLFCLYVSNCYERLWSIVTALHRMQTWSSDENSVCPSNVCIVTKRKKDLSRFLYRTKDHLTSFLREMVGVGGRPLLFEILVNRLQWSKIADFESIFARSASAVTPSEESSINISRKSTTRFSMSPRWSS